MLANFISPFFDPIVSMMSALLSGIHHVIPWYGVDLIALAFIIRLALFPIANTQFKSMAQMQKLQPIMKELQAKHKGDPQTLQTKTMELYREHGVNPFASCLPLLLQIPILFSLYYAIRGQSDNFKGASFLWIGSPLAAHLPPVFGQPLFGASLAVPDILLLVLYAGSMYFSIRYGSPPSTDPQQAQTQRLMAFISPAMIAVFGFRGQWPSALILYWLSLNVFTMAQQLWLFRRFGLLGGKAATASVVAVAPSVEKNVTAAQGSKNSKNRGKAAAGKGAKR